MGGRVGRESIRALAHGPRAPPCSFFGLPGGPFEDLCTSAKAATTTLLYAPFTPASRGLQVSGAGTAHGTAGAQLARAPNGRSSDCAAPLCGAKQLFSQNNHKCVDRAMHQNCPVRCRCGGRPPPRLLSQRRWTGLLASEPGVLSGYSQPRRPAALICAARQCSSPAPRHPLLAGERPWRQPWRETSNPETRWSLPRPRRTPRPAPRNFQVCFEYLFESVDPTTVLRCGHTIHAQCLKVRPQQ